MSLRSKRSDPPLPQVPVFRPTIEEFKDFQKYVESIYPQIEHIGLARIIPPKEWKAIKQLHNTDRDYTSIYDELFDFSSIEIPHPIVQNVEKSSRHGCYQLLLLENRPTSVRQFQKMASKSINLDLSDLKNEEKTFEQIHTKFWRSVFLDPPVYGADFSGSFFDEQSGSWNVNNLNTILKLVGVHLPGITSSYLYFGMYRAMFAWHVEDMNLPSINYIHFGAPKHWYCIPHTHSKQFEEFAKNEFPEEFKECKEFIRHKTTVISPHLLVKHNIPVYTTVQKEGEFIITCPYSYHMGFNHGFNCAESANFALDVWIDFGKKANWCKCQRENASINMDAFLQSYEKFKLGEIKLEDIKLNHEDVMILKRDMKGSMIVMDKKRKREVKEEKQEYQTKKEMKNKQIRKKICNEEDCNPEFCFCQRTIKKRKMSKNPFPAFERLSHEYFIQPKMEMKEMKNINSTQNTTNNQLMRMPLIPIGINNQKTNLNMMNQKMPLPKLSNIPIPLFYPLPPLNFKNILPNTQKNIQQNVITTPNSGNK